MARKLLKMWLKCLAKWILRKYRPRIVAITGSTGKTTTKEAILAVLKRSPEDCRVIGTVGNMNTEFGVTASIIQPGFTGTATGVKVKLSIKDVVSLTKSALRKLLKTCDYPKVLVLELAADRPGDIQYFMSFITPEVGVLTNIGDVHLEFFGSKAELVEEKSLVISHTTPKGLAILNKDDDFSKLISRKTNAKKTFIGIDNPADVTADSIAFGSKGVHFNIMVGQQLTQIDLPVLGYQFIYSALFAFAVGEYFKIARPLIANRLAGLTLPSRRFEIIRLEGVALIDDTYNANPTSMIAALKSLARLGVNRKKIAVLGDMRELGSAHLKGHHNVGQYAAKVLDQLWVVGEGGQLIKTAAIEAGLDPEMIGEFSPDALPLILQDNSIVLVKGSQGVRMDQIVELIKQYSYERSCKNSH